MPEVIEEFDTPGSSTWTVPKGVEEIVVEVYGAGAAGLGGFITITGGKSATPTKESGSGGASGAYCKKTIPVSEGDVFNYTVGAGGFKGSSRYDILSFSSSQHTLGEESTFSGGSVNMSAPGGGVFDTNDGALFVSRRGSASGGDINTPGNWGDSSPGYSGSGSPTTGSDGGNGVGPEGGTGGEIFLSNGHGENATGIGAGGHGGNKSTAPPENGSNFLKANPTGGNGGDGFIKITYIQKLFTSFLNETEVDTVYLGETEVDAGFFGENEVG